MSPADGAADSAPWALRSFGKSIHAATTAEKGAEPQRVCIIDIGSNSLKAIVYDTAQQPPVSIGKYDKILGLAEGMKPNDPKPKLNKDALALLFDKALPQCADLIKETKADLVTVLCTEAVRAVGRYDPQTVKEFRRDVAAALGVPKKAVNVISEATEAALAAKAVLYGNATTDGFAVTAGGGSTEIAEIKHGHTRPGRRATLRFGARTLTARNNAPHVVKEGLNRADWFRAVRAPHGRRRHHKAAHNGVEANGHDRGRDLILQGGSFRVVGRVLAQNLLNIDFASDLPFGGYSFAHNGALDKELKQLRKTDFAAMEEAFIRREHTELKEAKGKEIAHFRATKTYRKWRETPRYKKWYKRIGQRADFIAAAVEIILAVEKKVQPRTMTFSAQTMREGALMHAGFV